MDVARSHTGEHTDPNGELVVEGGANLATAFAGGLPVCGISFLSSENALLGAQTPVAGFLHSILLLGLLLPFSPFLPFIPRPVIAALILSAAWNMTHWGELRLVLKSGSTEMAAWLAIAALTFVDLGTGVAAGLLLGMFLHIRNQRALRLGQTL
jgi:SulP family sulfate permease